MVGCIVGLLTIPISLPLLIYFDQLGQLERGWLILGLLLAFAAILYDHRNSLGQTYFVAVAPPLFVAQFLGALIVPLPDWHIQGRAVMPLVVGVLLLNVGVFRLFRWIWERR